MTDKDKAKNETSDDVRQAAIQDQLSGVAGGSHERWDPRRVIERREPRNDMGSGDLGAVAAGCGRVEQRRDELSREDLSDVAAGANRQTRRDDRYSGRRDAPTITATD